MFANLRYALVACLFSGCAATTPEMNAPSYETVESRIPMMMSAYGVDGMAVIVVSGQGIALANGYGVTKDGAAYTTDTICGLYSATKAMSSLAIASMVKEGAFDIDAPIGAYLNDAPDAWKEIPFWRLLNHTSGITMIVNKPVFETIAGDPASGNDDIYRAIRGLPFDYQPGEYSRYRQSGYAIAEMIFEQRFGADWPAVMAARVTGPAGAAHTGDGAIANGERTRPLLSSAGGMQTSANDMGAVFKALNSGKIVDPMFLEDLLYNEKYDFDGYSLGSILETLGGVRTLGHRGGGARANIRYAAARGVGVMVCTDDRSNNELAIDLATMLMREFALGERVLTPIAAPLLSMADEPAKKIVAFFEAARDEAAATYDFASTERTLNTLGYEMMSADRVDDAVALFRLNVAENPNSANAFDSLGEALLAAGDLAGALQAYSKVLELDPGNTNALAMMEKIDDMTNSDGK